MATLISLFTLLALCLQGTVSQLFPFRDSPADTLALTNTPVTLTCSAPDPSPPPSILWFHNDIFVDSTTRITISYNGTTGVSEYRINSVSYYDIGMYQCFAVDQQGQLVSSSNAGNFTVEGHPAFMEPLTPVIVPLGGQAVFECEVLSNPPANVSWRGPSSLPLSNGDRISVTPSTLTVSGVQASDEGFYECIATNDYGTNTTSSRITIGDPPVPLEVTISPAQPNPFTLTEGEDLLLRCTVAEGAEVMTITWFRDSLPVSEGVSSSSEGLLLSIISVQVEEGGSYMCVATGPDDSDSATITVEVFIPPIFEVIPDDITTIANTTLSSTPRCLATGIPVPGISWLRPSGEVLPAYQNGSSGEIVPVLGVLRREDAGVYVCVAANVGGEERTEFTITVEDVPLITVPPGNTEASYGQDVTFTCTAVGPPDPQISWRRLDDDIQNGSVQAGNELHLFSVTVTDSGVYQCIASNVYGTRTATANLNILDRPRVESISSEVYIRIGMSFILNCTATGPPSTTISWYHNGTLVNPARDPRVEISTESLVVSDATASYSGEYTCNASTSYAYDVAHVSVTVGAVPVITTPPTNTDLTPGGSTYLDCGVTGLPPPRITWYKTDVLEERRQLPIVGETFVVFTDGIQFSNVVQDDTGVYECVAENVIGRFVANASLRVEGPAIATRLTPTVLIAGDTYTLTCEVLYNFPPAAIVWARTDGTELPPQFVTQTDGSLRIAPVEPEDQAEYSCRAINSYGDSSISAFVTVHVHPSITLPSTHIIAILTTNTSLTCLTAGRPPPSIHWIVQDGPNITNSTLTGPHYEFNATTGELNINDVIASDDGVYTCVASNIVGTASAEVQVDVRGAAVTNAAVSALSSTVLHLTWGPPPTELSAGLLSYQVEFGIAGSNITLTSNIDNLDVRQYIAIRLEEGTTYEFAVRGIYEEGIDGLDSVVTGRTRDDIPTGSPRNITLEPREEALEIIWLPPSPEDDNGLIILYNIFFRRSPSNSTEFVEFTLVEVTPTSNETDVEQTYTLGGLSGGTSYDVKLQAANSLGYGPNSTVVSASANDGPTSSPLPLILTVTIPIGVALLAVLAVLLVVGCCYWCRKRSQLGKHTPLMEEHAFEEHQRRKLRHRGITGPIPGISPQIDNSVPGKFSIQSKDGTVLSTNPKVINPEDVAPPPAPGTTVQKVPRNQIITSQQRYSTGSFDPYDMPEDAMDETSFVQQRRINPYNLPEDGIPPRPSSGIYEEPSNYPKPPPRRYVQQDVIDPYATSPYHMHADIRIQPIQEEDEERNSEMEGSSNSEGENNLSASRNALDLSSGNLVTAPYFVQTEEQRPETTRDNTHLIYASVSPRHRAQKRSKMLHEQQKREMKARRDQRKMHEKMMRDKKKQEAKARQNTEKERKRQDKEKLRRHELGLDNVVRLHEVDLSTQKGRAQAHFIDAATAAIF